MKNRKRYCFTRTKTKYFNEAWALIGAAELEAKYGSNLRTYKCLCGWWHVYDQTKKRQKDESRESRSARRKRRHKEKREARQARRQLRYQRRKEFTMAVQVWENEGGACST